MAKRTQDFGVPIFTDVWPLLSGRQADFLHNEVPGIVVPEQVRIQMAGSEGDEGGHEGWQSREKFPKQRWSDFPGFI